MEYKYKEEIIKAIPNTQLEVYSDLSDELNEVYTKARAFDANYAMETSVISTAAVIGLQDKLRKAESWDEAKVKINEKYDEEMRNSTPLFSENKRWTDYYDYGYSDALGDVLDMMDDLYNESGDSE